MNETIIYISDFAFIGSGYLQLSVPLCRGLAERGYKVLCIGLNYTGQEHNFPFTIIPCKDFSQSVAMLGNLVYLENPQAVIVALDLPHQSFYLEKNRQFRLKYVCITPLENPPLTMSWAAPLMEANAIFFISEMGKQAAIKAGLVNAEHIQIGMEPHWKIPTAEEKDRIRKAMNLDGKFVVLTVADNQERKNLWAGLEIISKLKKDGVSNLKYILITREQLPVGWRLRDLTTELRINEEVSIVERGLPFSVLWTYYSASDLFLLTSKAEGLCNLPYSKIWTMDGLKEIKDVRKDDLIITHTGKVQYIDEIFIRKISEYINKIKIAFGLPELLLTNNHPILGAKRFIRKMENGEPIKKENISLEWIDSQNLEKGDYVFFPELPTKDIEHITTPEYLSGVMDFIIDGSDVASVASNQTGGFWIHPNGKRLPVILEITPELMRLLGWYIAEGCDTNEGISFSLHANEHTFRKEIRELLNKLFGLELKDTFRSRHRYDGRVFHTMLGRLFSSMCGKDSHSKRIPNWALFLPSYKLWPLVESLFNGDGTVDFNAGTLRYSTVSEILARQLQFILLKLGIVSSFRCARNRLEFIVTIYRPESFKIPFIHGIKNVKKKQKQFIKVNGGWLFPIRENKKKFYSGDVYNLEIPVDNTYLMGGGVVHNCLPILESMATGVPVLATHTGAIPEILEDGRGYTIPPEYTFRDVWGNAKRDMVDIEAGAKLLKQMMTEDLSEMTKKAKEYVDKRTWDIAVNQLEGKLRELLDDKKN